MCCVCKYSHTHNDRISTPSLGTSFLATLPWQPRQVNTSRVLIGGSHTHHHLQGCVITTGDYFILYYSNTKWQIMGTSFASKIHFLFPFCVFKVWVWTWVLGCFGSPFQMLHQSCPCSTFLGRHLSGYFCDLVAKSVSQAQLGLVKPADLLFNNMFLSLILL